MSRPQPFSVMAEATVFDVNRQAWTGASSLLVHPADLYVGLHSDQTFVKKRDAAGNPGYRNRFGWQCSGGTADRYSVLPGWNGATVRGAGVRLRPMYSSVQLTSATEPVLCTFDTPNGGEYRITATIQDESGRENMSEFTRWVSGGQPAGLP